MRRLFASMFVGIAMLCAACSGQGSVTTPSAVAAAAAPVAQTNSTSGVHVDLTAPVVSDACKPSTNSVAFDPNQLGRVTITNNSPCTNDFLYIVWRVSGDDETNQTLVAMRGARLAPGERREFTLGFADVCGTKYQRDVYIGVGDDRRTYSFSDMSNYFFAALGYYQYGSRCDTPPSDSPAHPINPPIDLCPNLEGNQASMPPGFTLNDGVCVPVVNPVDLCPNIDGVQSTVPAGYTLVGGLCVPVPPPPPLCTDATASNFGLPAPCVYPPPVVTCGPFSFSGPIHTNVPNSSSGRLAYARSFGPAYSTIEAVHPFHGGSFSGNEHSGFRFTPSADYAVIMFQSEGSHTPDYVYTGVTAGMPLNVPGHDVDVFYFDCPR